MEEDDDGDDDTQLSRKDRSWVLTFCSKSTDLHRPFYTFSFLLSWMEWNKQHQALEEVELGKKDVVVDEIASPLSCCSSIGFVRSI